jgi:hypothetical protein
MFHNLSKLNFLAILKVQQLCGKSFFLLHADVEVLQAWELACEAAE